MRSITIALLLSICSQALVAGTYLVKCYPSDSAIATEAIDIPAARLITLGHENDYDPKADLKTCKSKVGLQRVLPYLPQFVSNFFYPEVVFLENGEKIQRHEPIDSRYVNAASAAVAAVGVVTVFGALPGGSSGGAASGDSDDTSDDSTSEPDAEKQEDTLIKKPNICNFHIRVGESSKILFAVDNKNPDIKNRFLPDVLKISVKRLIEAREPTQIILAITLEELKLLMQAKSLFTQGAAKPQIENHFVEAPLLLLDRPEAVEEEDTVEEEKKEEEAAIEAPYEDEGSLISTWNLEALEALPIDVLLKRNSNSRFHITNLDISWLDANVQEDTVKTILIGERIINLLLDKDSTCMDQDPVRYKKAVEYVMHAFWQKAHEMDALFHEGSFVIVGDECRIHDFIFSGDYYWRVSSHLKDRSDFIHYGFDLADLPFGKKTLLFFKFKLMKGEDATFIKPENFGTYKLNHIIGHGVEWVESVRVRSSGSNKNDVTTGYRKERVPENLLQIHKKFVEILPDEQKQEKLKKAKRFGVASMFEDLNSNQTSETFKEFMAAYTQYNLTLDHIEVRTGKEVIIDLSPR